MAKDPTCLIITGRPGSGKTTLTTILADRLRLPTISRDTLKEGYVSTAGAAHDKLPADTNKIVTELFFEIVKHHLAGRISVIIEAAFQHFVWQFGMPQIQKLSRPIVLICKVEGQTAAGRHLERGLADPLREYFHGDAAVALYRSTGKLPPPAGYEAPKFDVPTIHVSTTDGYKPPLDQLVDRILEEMAHE